MATKDECAAALERLAEKLGGLDDDRRAKNGFERTVSCTVPDLGVAFHGRMKDATLKDVVDYDDVAALPNAQIKLTIPSDDLLALVDGRLNFVQAWTAGRIKVSASFGDLLKLRKIF
ncbi:MAG TPA: sterol-binding protein [Actinospica sp.]|nr:sterol-binding protein [Actinospica sp.]